MNGLVSKVMVLALLAVTLGVMLTLLPIIIQKYDVVIKTFSEVESTRAHSEGLEQPAIITATSLIVPGLIAGFLAFILTKRLGR